MLTAIRFQLRKGWAYATIRLLRSDNIGDGSYPFDDSRFKITYDLYAHWIPGTFNSEVDDLDSVKPATLQNEQLAVRGWQNEAKKWHF